MKKIKILICICLILLIALLGFLLLNPELKSYRQLDEILVSDQMDEHLVLPSGLYMLMSEYKGSLTTEIISKQYNHYATVLIPKYYKNCKDLSSDELNSFFNKNSKVIYIELGYDNVTDFEKFINVLKTLKGENLEFESYSLLIDSLQKTKDGKSMYLSIKYKDNSEVVFNSYVERKKTEDRPSIILKTDVDMVSLEKKIAEKEEEKEQQEEAKKQDPNYVEGQEIPKSGRVIN